jgi:hypothetical protein
MIPRAGAQEFVLMSASFQFVFCREKMNLEGLAPPCAVGPNATTVNWVLQNGGAGWPANSLAGLHWKRPRAASCSFKNDLFLKHQ